MKLSRISEIDLAYVAFWLALMGGFWGFTVYLMVKIEKNTRHLHT